MIDLPFRLPDFTRVSWASDHARAAWDERLSAAAAAWSRLEWLSVAEGLRACALQRMSPATFDRAVPEWRARRVSALGLAREAVGPSTYAAAAAPAVDGQPWVARVALGGLRAVEQLREAWLSSDDDGVGELLGYPACCRAFFTSTWRQGLVDTTWPMAANSVTEDVAVTALIEVDASLATNTMWRWFGIRAVPHLPCSYGCEATAALAHELRELARSEGLGAEFETIEEVLAWSVEWSALHGIAEVKTPILKVATRSDATATKRTVRLRGCREPIESAQGLGFPYRANALARGRPAASAVATPVRLSRPRWDYEDNGFPSLAAMTAAHEPIVELAVRALRVDGKVSIIDLGCGNGALLRAIADVLDDRLDAFGMDVVPERIARARRRFPYRPAAFVVGDFFGDEWPWGESTPFDLAILMSRRPAERSAEDAARLAERLTALCDRVLLYDYESEAPPRVVATAAVLGATRPGGGAASRRR